MLSLLTSLVSHRVRSGKVLGAHVKDSLEEEEEATRGSQVQVLLFENSQSSHDRVMPTMAKEEGKLETLREARWYVRSRNKTQVYGLGIS